ncbi:MAG: proline dehydrogenase family protein [Anaerolineae bacterium]
MMREALIWMSRSQAMGRMMTTNPIAWSAASRFVAGETIEEAIDVVRRLAGMGLMSTLDYLGENVTDEDEAVRSCDAYLNTIDHIRSSDVESWISLKLTALGFDISDELTEGLLRRIIEHAADGDPAIFVRIDMEGSPYTQRTLDMFYKVFEDYSNVGIVIQSYLYRSDDDVETLVGKGAGVRLCKGAYSEPPSIAYPDKKDADEAYRRLTARLLSDEARANGTYLGVATHDEAIIEWTKGHAADNGIGPDEYEFQMLNGVRRDLQRKLVADGYRMRVYVPYGTHWYPYFMRRLAERPENIMFMARNMVREIGK